MTLVLDVDCDDVPRLHRYARGTCGGFQALAKAMLATLVERDDGSGFARLDAWPHIAAYRRQLETPGQGGFHRTRSRL